MKKNRDIYPVMPNNFDLTISILVSFVRSNIIKKKPVNASKQIKGYALLKEMNKNKNFRNFSIGIYGKNGKKYFIKTWYGAVHDINYYLLLNEYIVSRILNSKNSILKDLNIRVPKVVDLEEGSTTLSVIFEYVNGTRLDLLSRNKQSQVLSKVLRSLNTIYERLSENEKKLFMKKKNRSYLTALPEIAVLAIIFNPKYIFTIVKGVFESIRNYSVFSNYGYSLAHRDLNLTNIIVNRNEIYLVDLERMAITSKYYDIGHLDLIKELENIPKYIFKDTKYPEFLKIFMNMHYLVSNNYALEYKRYYLNKLKLNV